MYWNVDIFQQLFWVCQFWISHMLLRLRRSSESVEPWPEAVAWYFDKSQKSPQLSPLLDVYGGPERLMGWESNSEEGDEPSGTSSLYTWSWSTLDWPSWTVEHTSTSTAVWTCSSWTLHRNEARRTRSEQTEGRPTSKQKRNFILGPLKRTGCILADFLRNNPSLGCVDGRKHSRSVLGEVGCTFWLLLHMRTLCSTDSKRHHQQCWGQSVRVRPELKKGRNTRAFDDLMSEFAWDSEMELGHSWATTRHKEGRLTSMFSCLVVPSRLQLAGLYPDERPPISSLLLHEKKQNDLYRYLYHFVAFWIVLIPSPG